MPKSPGFKHVLLILMVSTLVHIGLATTIGLGDDESYYWQWAHHLSLSYYDHPPLVAYLIALSTHILGNSPLAVRFANILILPILSLIVYFITNTIYRGRNISVFAVFLLNILPVFALGGLLVAPDLAMVFCYTLGIYFLLQIVQYNKGNYWYWLGIITGIGLLAKYTMVFMYLGVALYLVLDPNSRLWFKDKRPYIAFLLSIIIFTPVIIWNYEHHFASFVFQFYSRHNHSFRLDYISFLSFVGSQFILLSPIFAGAFMCVVYKTYAKPNNLLLLCFGLPPLILFGLVSLFSAFKPTWAVMAYVPLVIMFAGNSQGIGYSKTKLWGIITTGLLIGVVLIQVYYPLIRIQPLKNDNTNDFYGWDKVAVEVDKFMHEQNNQNQQNSYSRHNADSWHNAQISPKWFIFSHTYQLSAQLGYALNNKYPVYSLADHPEGYSFWQDEAVLLGRNGLLVMTNFYQIDPNQRYRCDQILPYRTIDILRAGLVVRQVFLYECINYHGRRM